MTPKTISTIPMSFTRTSGLLRCTVRATGAEAGVSLERVQSRPNKEKERPMFSNRFARMLALAILLAPALAAQVPSASDPPKYVLPPKEIVDVLDAPPPPLVVVSPSRQVIAEESRTAHPTIAELAQPMLRLAGSRISPKSNGPRLPGNVHAITLKRIADGAEVKVAVPPQAKL